MTTICMIIKWLLIGGFSLGFSVVGFFILYGLTRRKKVIHWGHHTEDEFTESNGQRF